MSTMENKKENKTFYYWLDPIRAVAALLVLLVHARSVMFPLYVDLQASSQGFFTQIFYLFCSLGGFAVSLFFLLSGFLVGGQTLERINNHSVTPKRFFLDRLFRIGVPLTGALIVIVIVNAIIGEDIEIIQLIGQYTGLQGVLFKDYGGVFWTLAYEIWFYVLLFAIVIFSTRRRIIFGMVMLALALMVFCELLPRYLYILALGMACYYLKNIKISSKAMTATWIIAILCMGLYMASTTNAIANYVGNKDLLSKFVAISQLSLFSAIALILSQSVVCQPQKRLNILINKYGKKLATFSYSLFLTHYSLLKLWLAFGYKMDEIDVRSISIFVGYCFLCIIFAYIFYLCVERNTKKIQKAFEKALHIQP